MTRRTIAALVSLVLGIALAAAGGAGARTGDTTLSLVAYSVPRDALGAVIKAWQQTPDGRGVGFTQSYGASGDQARAVAAGLDADVVQLSTGLDVDALVRAGLVDRTWDRQTAGGIATNSVVVFAVRDGNPEHIRSWSDLVRPGVQIVTPNPASSGAAKWNVMAAYGAQRRLGKTDRQAVAFVEKLTRNVVSLDTSARNATNTFLSGRGDVFVTYENEARLAKLQYVIPRQTLLIEAPIALVETSDHKTLARKFIRFTRSPQAQRIFAQYGFRPVLPSVYQEFLDQYPKRPGIFRITDRYLGGWSAVEKRWFDPDKGLWVGIAKRTGVGA
ncbi:MAG TPA: sulfate ABC transporter substrate-binding protein [Gaiella sp.]|nr:sulfate ABC transporter substrate-binding protein [Gaiella sp.]